MDTEIAAMHDILALAQRTAVQIGWRRTCRALYYALMRVAGARGQQQLADFLRDPTVGW
jgi:hypothetical protein